MNVVVVALFVATDHIVFSCGAIKVIPRLLQAVDFVVVVDVALFVVIYHIMFICGQ